MKGDDKMSFQFYLDNSLVNTLVFEFLDYSKGDFMFVVQI